MSDELNNNPAPIITKACSKCHVEQPLENYRKNPSNKKDGLQLECKKCNNERASNYYQKNKKKIIKGILSSRKKKSKLQKEIEKLEKQINNSPILSESDPNVTNAQLENVLLKELNILPNS